MVGEQRGLQGAAEVVMAVRSDPGEAGSDIPGLREQMNRFRVWSRADLTARRSHRSQAGQGGIAIDAQPTSVNAVMCLRSPSRRYSQHAKDMKRCNEV